MRGEGERDMVTTSGRGVERGRGIERESARERER